LGRATRRALLRFACRAARDKACNPKTLRDELSLFHRLAGEGLRLCSIGSTEGFKSDICGCKSLASRWASCSTSPRPKPPDLRRDAVHLSHKRESFESSGGFQSKTHRGALVARRGERRHERRAPRERRRVVHRRGGPQHRRQRQRQRRSGLACRRRRRPRAHRRQLRRQQRLPAPARAPHGATRHVGVRRRRLDGYPPPRARR
jgi:hypothetical protein